ncbi:MAG: hypothetical protein Q8M54_08555 [Desulfobaccales bacterium]|nr:hypothetical protein [Desulfobaccales bacterium]
MKKGRAWLELTMIGMALIALAGCAAVQAIQKSEAMDKEQLLTAAGFRVRLADTPQKLAHLQTLTQRKLIAHQRDGKVYYVYADALACKCLYIGNEEAYQRYQQLVIQQQIADQQRMTAEMNYDAQMNWGMWGPYDPWW